MSTSLIGSRVIPGKCRVAAFATPLFAVGRNSWSNVHEPGRVIAPLSAAGLRRSVWIAAVFASALAAGPAGGASITWIGGNVDWVDEAGTANWSPADEPDTDDVAIFNTANTVNLGSNNSIQALTLSGGIDLKTNAFDLTIDGLLQLVDAGTNFFIGDSASLATIDNVTINNGGSVNIDGGQLTLIEETGYGLIDINAGGTLAGYGTLRFNDTVGAITTMLFNDGTLSAQSKFGLFIGAPPAETLTVSAASTSARIDLDGSGENGIVQVARNQTLDLNVAPSDAFGGTMNLAHNSTLDIAAGWTLNGGTLAAENGFVAGGIPSLNIPADVSYLSGGTFTQSGGTITVVDSDGTLQFNAPFSQTGGSLVNNGLVVFNANSTIGAGANFTMPGTTSSLQVNAGVQVNVDQANFNADGGGVATNLITVNSGGALTLNLGAGADESLGGTLNLNGGSLVVNTADDTWSLGRAVNVGAGSTAYIDGEAVELSCDITVPASSVLHVLASSTLIGGSSIAVAAGGVVNLSDSTVLQAADIISGEGTLRISGSSQVTGTVTIGVSTFDWDGTSIGQTHSIGNAAVLTVNSPSIDSDNGFDDALSLGGSGSSVIMNGPKEWLMRQTLTTNPTDTGTATIGGTSRLELTTATGIFNANGDTIISAPFTFGASSTTNVAAPALLTLSADSTRFEGGAIAGAGTLRLNGSSSATAGTTVAVNTFDWDGTASGSLHSIAAGVVFTINSTVFDDDGDMDDPLEIGGNSAALNVSGVASWTMLNTLTTNPTDTGTATIGGTARLLLSSATGILNANGDTTVSAPFTFGAGSTTNVAANALLNLSHSDTRFEGGSIAGAGTLRVGNTSNTTANTTITVNTLDWDGTGSGSLHTINDGVTFAITSPVFDDDGDMDDPITLGGGGGTLTVNGSASWTMRNTLTCNPGATGTAIIGGTSRMVLTSASAMAFNVSGDTTVSAPITFGLNSTTTVPAPAVLTVNGNAVYSGGTIGGDGTFHPSSTATNTVTSNSTITTTNFNFDRGNWLVEPGATLTVNVGDYDPDAAADGFDTLLTVNSGGVTFHCTAGEFVVGSGEINLQNSGSAAVWQGDSLVIGNDAGTLDAELSAGGSGASLIAVPVTFRADADVGLAAGSSLVLADTATFQTVNGILNAGFTGAGTLVTNGTVNFNEAVTFQMAGGTLDLDGTNGDLGGNTINIDAPVVVNAAAVSSFGKTNTVGINLLEIDNLVAAGTFTVNLDDPAAEWTLNASGMISLLNDATEATLLSGAALNLAGTANVTGDVRCDARLDITGTVNILTAGEPLRLSGGSGLTEPNTIAGGTINGPGILGADQGSHLVGHGTIAANVSIDFDNTTHLLADNGTLVVNGSIVDAYYVGTNDSDGILQIVPAWDSMAANTIDLKGGELKGGTITLNNAAGIYGHGLVSSRIINNTRLEASGAGQTLVVATAANDNDWDGSAAGGQLRASSGGTLEIRDTVNFSFSGTVQALSATVFVNGFPLTLAGTSVLNLNNGTYRQSEGIGSTISGDVNIGSGTSTIITDGASGGITFSNTNVTVLTGDLVLNNPTTLVQSGANFSGAGRLINLSTRQLQLANGSNLDVLVENRGRFQPGGVNVAARNDLRDFVQTASGKFEVDLRGNSLGTFDRLLINGGAQLAGELALTIGGGYVPAVGDTLTILSTTGGITGTFNPLVQPAGMPTGTAFEVTYGATSVQLKVVSATAFDLWINSFPSLTNPADKTKTANPDHDQLNNLAEFGVDGNPASGVNTGKIVAKIGSVGGNSVLTLTFPVRVGATADPADPAGGQLVLKQTADGLTYTIQAGDNLTTWPLDVLEVSGADAAAIQAGLPALSSDRWQYRTFRTPGAVTGDPTEYIRVGIGE